MTDGSFAGLNNVFAASDINEEIMEEPIGGELIPEEEVVIDVPEEIISDEQESTKETEELVTETENIEPETEETVEDLLLEEKLEDVGNLKADESPSSNLIDVNEITDIIASKGGLDFSPNSSVIGKAKIDLSNQTATYYEATGASSGILKTIRVPRYLMLHSEVSKETVSYNNAEQVKNAIDAVITNNTAYLEGAMFWDESSRAIPGAADEFFNNLRIYDYSDGDTLIDGYKTCINSRGERVIEGYDETLAKPYSECTYVGVRYEVKTLDPQVFKNDSGKAVEVINIPKSITSEITVDFFDESPMVKQLNVYYQSDETLSPSDMYRSSPTENCQLNTASKYSASNIGVLIRKNPEPGVSYKIVYCPPMYDTSKYFFPYSDENSTKYIVGERAYKNCIYLDTVGWQNNNVRQRASVQRIEKQAFYGCTSLTTVEIFDIDLTEIGDESFYNCVKLGTVASTSYYDGTIHLHVGKDARIGKRAFGKTAITSLQIPAGYSDITGESLAEMTKLEKITVESSQTGQSVNTVFMAKDGILYRKDPGNSEEDVPVSLVCYPAAKEIENGVLPELPYKDDLKGDEDYTFMVPETVVSVDGYAFCEVSNLFNLIFLSTLHSLSENSVYACHGLAHVYSHSGMPDIEYSGTVDYFKNCKSNNRNLNIHTPKYYEDSEGKGLYNCSRDSGYTMHTLFDINDFRFENSGDGLTKRLVYVDPEVSGDLFIPDFVIEGGVKKYVTSVSGNGIFAGNSKITSVTILKHLKDVSSDAFLVVKDPEDASKDIVSLALENIFVEPGNNNFLSYEGALYKQEYNDTTKEYVVTSLIYYPPSNIQEEYTTHIGLVTLPRYAFRGAKNLKKINIYDTITAIGTYTDSHGGLLLDEPGTFSGCTSLIEINIIESGLVENKKDIRYTSGKLNNGGSDGVLYRCDNKGEINELVYYPKGKRGWYDNGHNSGTYEVMPGCKIITDIKDVKSLSTVKIPKSVTTIEDNAFKGTTQLRELVFNYTGTTGEGLKTIGDNAFANSGLASVTLPSTVTSIGDGTFENCKSMKFINICIDNLTYVGENAFAGNTILKTAEFTTSDSEQKGKNLVFGRECFSGDTALETFHIKKARSVEFGDMAFYRNAALTNFAVESTPISYLGASAFANCIRLKKLNLSYAGGASEFSIVYPSTFINCKSLQEIVLPESVAEIQSNAFLSCTSLNSVNFAQLSELKVIGDRAFANCDFKQVGLNSNSALTTLGRGAFSNNENLTAIYIPATVSRIERSAMDSLTTKTVVYTQKGSAAAKMILETLNSSTYDGDDPFTEIDYNEDWIGPRLSYRDIPNYVVHIFIDDSSPLYVQNIGATRQVSAYVECLDEGEDADQSVYFKSSDESVLTVDESGLVTLISSDKTGEFFIEAYSQVTGASAKIELIVDEAGIFIDGKSVDVAYINVNINNGYNTAYINATSNPTRSLYYEVVDAPKGAVHVSADGKITAKKVGKAKIKVYAKEGDGAVYDTYMEAFVIVNMLNPTIAVSKKSKNVTLYGEKTTAPIDRDKLLEIDAAMPNANEIDLTSTTVYVDAYSLGPDKKSKDNYVDNTVTWVLDNTNYVYMLDEEGNKVSSMTTKTGAEGNESYEASVRVYTNANVNKNVVLYAHYNGRKTKVKIKIKKISTAITPAVIDIYDVGKKAKIKTKIVGPDKKNLKWEFVNSDGTIDNYITGISKSGEIEVSPSVFAENNKNKKVYVFLTANGVRSNPCEVNIKQATAVIKVDEDNLIKIDGKQYIHINSAGNNQITVDLEYEGPGKATIKWESADKDCLKVKGRKGSADITGQSAGNTEVVANVYDVTAVYPVKVVDTYTKFTSIEGKELDLRRKIDDPESKNPYKSSDAGNKLKLEVKGTDKKAIVHWSSSNEDICKIYAIDDGIEGEKKSTYAVTQDTVTSNSDYGYKRISMVELNPQAKGSCDIIAEANGVITKYRIKVY